MLFLGAPMADFPKDRIPLRDRLQQQRNTVAALKRDGHDCPDAERQLRDLEIQARAEEAENAQCKNSDATIGARRT